VKARLKADVMCEACGVHGEGTVEIVDSSTGISLREFPMGWGDGRAWISIWDDAYPGGVKKVKAGPPRPLCTTCRKTETPITASDPSILDA
jgi:hypothetical protein